MSKVKAGSLVEFKQWILDQLNIEGRKLSDLAGYSARWRGVFDNYRLVFGSPDFNDLLAAVYSEGQPVEGLRTAEPLAGRLRSLTRELAMVSPDQFAGAHLHSKAGRARLRGILENKKEYGPQLRVDLVRAIARIRAGELAHGLHGYAIGKGSATVDLVLFDLNISNLKVSAQEMEAAVQRGIHLLRDADEIEAKTEARRNKYLLHPEKVRVLSLAVAEGDGRSFGPDKIKKYAALLEKNKDKADPLSQMRAKLADTWLLAVDDDNWGDRGRATTPANRAYLMRNAERLMARLEAVKSEAQFKAFVGELRSFLGAPLPSSAGVAKWADEKLRQAQELPVLGALPAATGAADYLEEDLFSEMSAADRAPFDGLKGLADELWAAFEMGETIPVRVDGLQAKDPKVQSAVENYIQGLERAKRAMWSGYKQKHWFYRTLATEGGMLAEDIPDIRAANRAIDGIIQRLKSAQSPADIRKVNQDLFAMTKAGGVLHKGFSAAATDWSAEISSLGATTLETVALAAVTGGGAASRLPLQALNAARKWTQVLRAARKPLQAVDKISKAPAALRGSRGVLAALRRCEAVRAAGLGAYIATAENVAANLSGQLKTQPDTILSWLKDAFATGMAMGVVAPLPPHAAAARKKVLQGMWARYFKNPAVGALRFTADTGKEVVEEVLDAYVRQALDGNYQALSLEQFADIVSVCAFGGAKMGLIKQVIGRGAGAMSSLSQALGSESRVSSDKKLVQGFQQRGERVVLDPHRRIYFLVDAEGGLLRKVGQAAALTYLRFEAASRGDQAQGLAVILFESSRRGARGETLAYLPGPASAKAKAPVSTQGKTAVGESEVLISKQPRSRAAEETESAAVSESVPVESVSAERALATVEAPWTEAEIANDNAQIPQATRATVAGNVVPLRPGVSPGLSAGVASAAGVANAIGSADRMTQARSHRVKAGEFLGLPANSLAQALAMRDPALAAPAPGPASSTVQANGKIQGKPSRGRAPSSVAKTKPASPTPLGVSAAPTSTMVLGFTAVCTPAPLPIETKKPAVLPAKPKAKKVKRDKSGSDSSGDQSRRQPGKQKQARKPAAQRQWSSAAVPAGLAAMAAGAAMMLKPASAKAATESQAGWQPDSLSDLEQFFRHITGSGLVGSLALLLGGYLVLKLVKWLGAEIQSRRASAKVASVIAEKPQEAGAVSELEGPKSDVDRLSQIIVEVHEKVSAFFAEQGQTLTLRDMLRAVDVLGALSLQNKLMPVFDGLHLILGMQFADTAQREEVFRLIEEVRLVHGPIAAEIDAKLQAESEFREETAGPEADSSFTELRAAIRKALRREETSRFGEIYKDLAKAQGKSLELWLGRLLKDQAVEVVETVLDSMGWEKSHEIAWIRRNRVQGGVNRLLPLLEDDDVNVRRSAANTLGQLGVKNEAVKQALIAGLEDFGSMIRWDVAEALGRLGMKDEAVKQALLAHIGDDSDVRIRYSSVEALGRLGMKDEAVQQALFAALEHSDLWFRRSAADALGQLGFQDEAVKQTLLAGLADPFIGDRESAAEALGRLGMKDEAVRQALLGVLEDPDLLVRLSAAEALGRLGMEDEAVKQALLGGLEDSNWEVRYIAATSLGRLEMKDEGVQQALLACLEDSDSSVCVNAAAALGQLGIKDEAV
ncbi:MAG TPA: HEAT repeat domain-containing protein, partial [bacterium]|nr:HEAT repeat domain-containing protein [bacterium]